MGLYCYAAACTKQLEVGDLGCLEDGDCVNSAGCDASSSVNRDLNICKSYITVDDYESFAGCSKEGEVNYMCKSHFCIDTGVSQCYPAP